MSDVASARTTGGQLGERRLGTIHAVAQALAIGPMFSTAIVLDEPVRPGVRRRAFADYAHLLEWMR
jgi:hypothetical protein